MSLKPPGDAVELSDEEGCRALVTTADDRRDNTKSSAKFIEQRGAEIHPALDVSEHRAEFSEADGQMQIFTIPEYKEEWDWCAEEFGFNAWEYDWSDLYEMMADAQAKHERSVSSVKGNPIKYLWNKTGQAKEAAQPWLSMFPDSNGLSVVKGAFGVIFYLAGQSYEKKQAILEGFATITETIEDTMSRDAEIFKHPEMHETCQEFQDCIIKGATGLIAELRLERTERQGMQSSDHLEARLTNGTGKKLFRRTKEQEKPNKNNVVDLLKQIERRAKKVDQCAIRIMDRKASETHKNVRDAKAGVAFNVAQLAGVREEQSQHREIAEQTRDSVQTVERTMAEFIPKIYAIATQTGYDQRRLDSLATASANAFLQPLVDSVNKLIDTVVDRNANGEPMRPLQDRPEAPRRVPDKVRYYVHVDDLDTWFPRVKARAMNDLSTVIVETSKVSIRKQEQAASLYTEKRFKKWLLSPQSDLLVVAGNFEADACELASATALLAYGMGAACERFHGYHSLYYFCGFNNHNGPNGLLVSLIMQLAVQTQDRNNECYFGLVRRDELPKLESDFRDRDFETLIYLFKKLVRALPRGTKIMCLIDGIAGLELRKYMDGLEWIFETMYRLVGTTDDRIIKFFISTPYQSTLVGSEIVHRHDYIQLVEGATGPLWDSPW